MMTLSFHTDDKPIGASVTRTSWKKLPWQQMERDRYDTIRITLAGQKIEIVLFMAPEQAAELERAMASPGQVAISECSDEDEDEDEDDDGQP